MHVQSLQIIHIVFRHVQMNSFDLHIQKASESPSENKNVQNSSDEKLRPSVKEQSSERAKVSGARNKI